MDSLTQAALGAAVGEVVLGQASRGKGAILGAIIGTIPDLDILVTPFFNELQKISVHRGYSHSIIFCLLGAFLIAYILGRVKWTASIPFRKRWYVAFLTLITHVLLDTFTSYGTQLFLPFTDWRVSLDSISIIDPLYTLPLVAGVGLTIFLSKQGRSNSRLPNSIGIMISSLYLIFTLGNKQHIERVFGEQLEKQDVPYFRLLTIPVKVGNMVWYGVAKDKTYLHIGRYSMLEKNSIQFDAFPINDQLLEGLDEQLVDRMKWFAQGFYTVAESEGTYRIYNMQCDMQGVRKYGDYLAPTAFYFEIEPIDSGRYHLSSGMHRD